MLAASVDAGSNTLRLLIGTVRDNEISRIYTARSVTRLAEGVRETGNLRQENIGKSLSALKDFSRSITEFGAHPMKAIGTSALREAKNGEAFVRLAHEETGILIEVISGTREAALTAKGVLAAFPDSHGSSFIIDIGGGSTEWIAPGAESKEAPPCGTVPLGAVNLLERFMTADRPSESDISALNAEIDASFRSGAWGTAPSFRVNRLIGTGGTITTLASIDLGLEEYDHARVHMHRISLGRLHQIRDRLTALPFAERQHVRGLEAGRADLIIPGVLLTIRLVELFGFDGITVSDFGLLEGLLREIHDEESL